MDYAASTPLDPRVAAVMQPLWEGVAGNASSLQNPHGQTAKRVTYSSSFTLSPDQPPDLSAYIPDFVDVPEGGVSWDVFVETKSIEYQHKDAEGRDIYGVKPEFSEDLKKLDGQIILMQGYMFPLESEEEQSLFLFGPFPVGCPYHYHAGPNLVIEARAKKKIKFDWEPVNLRGRLELVPRDDEYNVFYRLHEAELVK